MCTMVFCTGKHTFTSDNLFYRSNDCFYTTFKNILKCLLMVPYCLEWRNTFEDWTSPLGSVGCPYHGHNRKGDLNHTYIPLKTGYFVSCWPVFQLQTQKIRGLHQLRARGRRLWLLKKKHFAEQSGRNQSKHIPLIYPLGTAIGSSTSQLLQIQASFQICNWMPPCREMSVVLAWHI